ncbi:MAG: hypothetical protein JRF51_17420 [Deltaproteobacteria bacterium]|nr:hypothetical protein [Deltaproteobacteria bacterium]
MENEKDQEGLTLDKKTIDILVAHIIPTSKYFEARFDHMQDQIDGLKDDLRDFRDDVDRRFDGIKSDMDQRLSQVDKRFEQVDKRFEQIDKRFEQVDKRFDQVIASIERLSDKLDYRDEKQRGFTLRMFSIAIAISILGALGTFLKSLGLF